MAIGTNETLQHFRGHPLRRHVGAREQIPGLAFLKLPRLDRRGWALLGGLALALAFDRLLQGPAGRAGVVLRFGAWVDDHAAGLHFHLPWPIESVLFPKITQICQMQLGQPRQWRARPRAREKQMLTGDENLVEADASLWQVKDAGQYLFKVADPNRSRGSPPKARCAR